MILHNGVNQLLMKNIDYLGGKSYGGHDDVQTVFDQAILVPDFSPFPSRKNSNNHFPPPPASTPTSSSTQILKRKRCQHCTYSSTNKKRQSIM
jgi:hypothetical protein